MIKPTTVYWLYILFQTHSVEVVAMAARTVFTLSQVAQHKSNKDCWLVINGRVVDVTKFLEQHPGGEEVLLEVAGKDATKEFDAIGHSKEAQNLVLKYQVGVLQGHAVQDDDTYKETKTKEMSAFIVKDNGTPKYVTLLEFFVPLLFATSYFCYRCLTRQIVY